MNTRNQPNRVTRRQRTWAITCFLRTKVLVVSSLLPFQVQQAVARPEPGHAHRARGLPIRLTVEDQEEAAEVPRVEPLGPRIPSGPRRAWRNKEEKNEGRLGGSVSHTFLITPVPGPCKALREPEKTGPAHCGTPPHSRQPRTQLTRHVLIYSGQQPGGLGCISLKTKQTKLPALLELMFRLKK